MDVSPLFHFKNKYYYESLTTAVLFTYIFQVPLATWHVGHTHSINICWVSEMTFLKGQNYKISSFLKVYNLESLSYVEVCMCVCMCLIALYSVQIVQEWPRWTRCYMSCLLIFVCISKRTCLSKDDFNFIFSKLF